MYKLLTFPPTDDVGNVFVDVLDTNEGLCKTASAELHPDIVKYIGSIKDTADKLYVLVNALSAGEYYGANVNGDYFEEEQLLGKDSQYTDLAADKRPFGYKTFETNGGIYRHHKNKDPSKSLGNVPVSVYNPKMHRVELVVAIDRKKAKALGQTSLVEALDRGEKPAVSMGCRVKYDVCSVCGNKAKTRAAYCVHARELMGRIMPSGVKVCVRNPRPRFFDLSFVLIGADKVSYAMHKLASASYPLSVDAAKDAGLEECKLAEQKLARKQKTAEILKKLPAVAEKIVGKTNCGRPIPKALLKKAAANTMDEALATFSAAGIILSPSEFQYLTLTKIGSSLAETLAERGAVFAPVETVAPLFTFDGDSKYNEKLGSALAPYLLDRSCFTPFVSKRLLTKTAGSKDIKHVHETTPLLQQVSAAYNGYRVNLLNKFAHIVQEITTKTSVVSEPLNEWLLEDGFAYEKRAAVLPSGAGALLGLLPLAHLYSAFVKTQRSVGEPVNAVDSFIEKHPNFSASMAIGLGRLGLVLQQSGALAPALTKMVDRFL